VAPLRTRRCAEAILVVIWTTTPVALPANLAIAVHSREE